MQKLTRVRVMVLGMELQEMYKQVKENGAAETNFDGLKNINGTLEMVVENYPDVERFERALDAMTRMVMKDYKPVVKARQGSREELYIAERAVRTYLYNKGMVLAGQKRRTLVRGA